MFVQILKCEIVAAIYVPMSLRPLHNHGFCAKAETEIGLCRYVSGCHVHLRHTAVVHPTISPLSYCHHTTVVVICLDDVV